MCGVLFEDVLVAALILLWGGGMCGCWSMKAECFRALKRILKLNHQNHTCEDLRAWLKCSVKDPWPLNFPSQDTSISSLDF